MPRHPFVDRLPQLGLGAKLALPCWALFLLPLGSITEASASEDVVAFVETYCLDCHRGADAEARLDLEVVFASPMEQQLRAWRGITKVLAQRTMPPDDAEQPSQLERQQVRRQIRSSLNELFREAAKDPGPTVLRRLTNAEYGYAIEDLTGVRIDFDSQLIPDSVGTSGFTNSATGQFMQVDNLERYLESAKVVAAHAVIGSGPIYFAPSPGATGMELASIKRIKQLYEEYGFRTGAGEGAKPYGMERFPLAFEVAWRHRHRQTLGRQDDTLEGLANEFGIAPKFVRHIWDVLHTPNPPFPLSQVIQRWNEIPPPDDLVAESGKSIAHHAEILDSEMRKWQERFAASASAEEEKALLTWSPIQIPQKKTFLVAARRKLRRTENAFTLDLNDPTLFSEDGTVRLEVKVETADASDQDSSATVIFENPKFQFRMLDLSKPEPLSLKQVIQAGNVDSVGWGENPGGENIGTLDFAVACGQSRMLVIELPQGCRSGSLTIDARLDSVLGRDRVVRCVIQDVTNERPRSYSSLLRDANSPIMERWEDGLESYGTAFPQISHREPAPSDRDPIPPPYDATYNVSDRNLFHTAVKYFRDDDFLVEHMMPAKAVERLEQAWTDLLTSFDFHNINLRFVLDRYQLGHSEVSIETISQSWIESLPEQPQGYVAGYKAQFDEMQQRRRDAEPMHLVNLFDFARRAWRRALDEDDRDALRAFYDSQRKDSSLDHTEAVRSTITRVLVSPEFLYRAESVTTWDEAEHQESTRELSGTELATRLSLSLWSSIPDERLLRLAESGRLRDSDVLHSEVKRMLASPKARRMASEFFGQWLGFYRFDHFRGVDANAFPEFDDSMKRSMLDEAVSFFEYILREDRPYQEIIDADYSFLNEQTARHYGVEETPDLDRQLVRVEGLSDQHRGGVLSLGAVLVTTSAPLRTSPVKRGDWILRRLLGTPVPPPPADVGSIPAEEVAADGTSVREQLEVHRDNPSCMNCHVRIDPLGFALENYDSLGRWRTQYREDVAVDTEGVLPNGDVLTGLEDLKRHLIDQDDAIRRTLAVNLVAYILGRAETVSDSLLIDQVAQELQKTPQISAAILQIVQSPQFRQVRSLKLDRSPTSAEHSSP